MQERESDRKCVYAYTCVGECMYVYVCMCVGERKRGGGEGGREGGTDGGGSV